MADIEVSVSAHGGPEVLQVRPCSLEPGNVQLAAHEVLVRNHFAGINFIDTYFRSGLYKKPQLPYVCGDEGVGHVVQHGAEVPAALHKKRVAYFEGSTGSYATYTVVPYDKLFEIPDSITDEDAVALLVQGLTAHYLTTSSYVCTPGSIVVVHAAAGGTGLLVCQVAKLLGATVIGVCGGAAKAELAKQVGHADHVVDYAATQDWPAAVRALAPDGVHAVYDGVGKATFEGSLSVLRPRGSMIAFGNASGRINDVSPLALGAAGSVYLQRPRLGDFMLTPKERAQRTGDVFTWLRAGRISVTLAGVWPLEKAAEAQQALQDRKTTGKILLKCSA